MRSGPKPSAHPTSPADLHSPACGSGGGGVISIDPVSTAALPLMKPHTVKANPPKQLTNQARSREPRMHKIQATWALKLPLTKWLAPNFWVKSRFSIGSLRVHADPNKSPAEPAPARAPAARLRSRGPAASAQAPGKPTWGFQSGTKGKTGTTTHMMCIDLDIARTMRHKQNSGTERGSRETEKNEHPPS